MKFKETCYFSLIEVTFFVMISYIYFGKRRVSGKKILVEGSSQEVLHQNNHSEISEGGLGL